AEIQRFAEIAPRWPDIEVSPLVTQQEGKLRDQGQDARCLPLPQGHRDGLKKPSSTAAIATKYEGESRLDRGPIFETCENLANHGMRRVSFGPYACRPNDISHFAMSAPGLKRIPGRGGGEFQISNVGAET